MIPDPHCKIVRVRLKGSTRNITHRLPSKAIAVALELKAAVKRGK